METAKEYIEKYNQRLNEFLTNNEATEDDFIKKELLKLENCKFEIQNIKDLEFDTAMGFEERDRILKFIELNGLGSFYYSLDKKYRFLQNKTRPQIKTSRIIEKHKDEILKTTTNRKHVFEKLALSYGKTEKAIKQGWTRYSKLNS